jgi:hypothetical protein
MNLNALRAWGIAVSGGLMAIALAVSLQPEIQSATAQRLVDVAQAAPANPAAPIEFVVRFRGEGPIARAQARAARGGDLALAQRRIEMQLRRQQGFQGLCFGRFTAGAAEVVLRTCDGVPAVDRHSVQERWLQRLRAMRAIAYADANIVAALERAPG